MHAMSHSIIIILDDIDRISLPEVLGELAGLLDKRGPQHAVWVGPTHGRGGAEESHPPKCYYLREDVFFVATINKKRYRLHAYVCTYTHAAEWEFRWKPYQPNAAYTKAHMHTHTVTIFIAFLPPTVGVTLTSSLMTGLNTFGSPQTRSPRLACC